MEWRIIVPVLCLIGILHVPGNAAQANGTNSTNNATIVYRFSLRFSINDTFLSEYSNNNSSATIGLKNSITSQVKPLYENKYPNFVGFNILKFSNGSIVTEGELQFSNGSKPNATDLVQILNNGTFNFTIIANSTNAVEVTGPAATTPTPAPAQVGKISLVFKLTQTFKEIYSNLNNPETIELKNNITTECSRVYKSRYSHFYRMVILKFSNGSIVTDSVLEFNTTSTATPNATDVKNTLITAIANGNFSFKVDNTSIIATPVSENATTTTTTPATTAPAPAKVGKISLVFKIFQTFKDIYSTLTNPETIVLTNNITTECSRVYKSHFPHFYRMVILKFSNGSIVTDSVLEFNTTSTASPTATDVKNTLITAIANGNFSFKVDNTSIIATPVSENATTTTTTPATTAPTPAKVGKISLLFKIFQTFKEIYSNLTNPETIVLTNNITTECSRVYKSRFPHFYRMVILKFSNGSIVTDSVLEFNTTSTAIPTATDVKNTLITAIANGNFSFAIDNSSITATVISEAANRSPFLASMLTAVWMTLASLLLSAVMH